VLLAISQMANAAGFVWEKLLVGHAESGSTRR
jgi:hypothetical protein